MCVWCLCVRVFSCVTRESWFWSNKNCVIAHNLCETLASPKYQANNLFHIIYVRKLLCVSGERFLEIISSMLNKRWCNENIKITHTRALLLFSTGRSVFLTSQFSHTATHLASSQSSLVGSYLCVCVCFFCLSFYLIYFLFEFSFILIFMLPFLILKLKCVIYNFSGLWFFVVVNTRDIFFPSFCSNFI